MTDPTERFDEHRAAAGVRDVTSDPEPELRSDEQLRQRAVELGAELGDAPVLHLSADPAALAADGGGDDPDAAAHELDELADELQSAAVEEELATLDGPPRPAAIGNRRPPALRQRLDAGAVEARTHDPRDPS